MRVVIVGGGFGGAYCARALEKRIGRDVDEVVLLDRNNYFVFYPLVAEAGTGSLEPRHAVVPLRSFLSRATFRMGEVLGVDPAARTVRWRVPGPARRPHHAPTRGHQEPGAGGDAEERTRRRPDRDVEDGEPRKGRRSRDPDGRSGGAGGEVGPYGEREMSYDHLVLAPGSVTRLPPVPGLAEHGFDLKSVPDAVALRDRMIRMLEIADGIEDVEERRRLLRVVVVGANFTGVEVAGEFHHFLHAAKARYPHVHHDDIEVVLIEITDRILPALDPDLSEFALEHLRRRGVRVLLETSVEALEPERARLAGGEDLPVGTVVWAAGIAPAPLLGRIPGLPLDERGYVLCDPDTRVRGFDDLWAIGDSAVNPDPDGEPYPATAQHATRQGTRCAANVLRAIRGEPTEPAVIDTQGSIAALGCRTGVAKLFGVKLAGFPAWFLYRTVYLMKMPTWARRVRIALDWTADLLFRREYVQLGVHRGPSGNDDGG